MLPRVTPHPRAAMEREALKALLRDKDAMEAEMAGISEALSADNLGGVRTPVIDAEGYPRADIDVHTTLTLRNRLARLNSDHCELMGRIEAGLRGVFTPSQGQTSSNAAVPPAAPPPRPVQHVATTVTQSTAHSTHTATQPAPVPRPVADVAPTGTTQPAPAASTGPIPMEVMDISELDLTSLSPFAQVDEVATDGPAAAAGLRLGDGLLRFGAIHAGNHDGLRALARLTQRSVGEAIALLVLREEEEAAEGRIHVRLELRPRRWSGAGLLGCHLRPL